MTSRLAGGKLSAEGVELLSDSLMKEAISAVSASVNVTPEEYLLRFEEVLSQNPEAIFAIFET